MFDHEVIGWIVESEYTCAAHCPEPSKAEQDDGYATPVFAGDEGADDHHCAQCYAEQTHWGYGSGMPGCLFDNGPHFAETQDAAIDAALWLFSETGNETDLSEAELATAREDLRRDGVHYLARPLDHGAALVQIWQEQGPCPESDE